MVTRFRTSLDKVLNNVDQSTGFLFMGLVFTILSGTIAGILSGEYLLFGLPILYLIVFLAIIDFRKLFYLLLISIPVSTEINLPGGFGTDFPSELLAIGLSGIFLFYLLVRSPGINIKFFLHPISLLLLVHITWIGVSTLHASDKFVATKFLLAKLWYILTYYCMAGMLLKSEKDIKMFFKCIFFPLLFTIVVIMVRHSLTGFSFKDINFVLNPFYRNHVTYASIIVVFFPFLWYAPSWAKKFSAKWWGLIASIIFFLAAIYLSYTRAAYICLVIATGAYLIIKFRLTKVVLAIGICLSILGLNWLENNNKYLDYAPDYNKTIVHQKFENLLEATTKGEDISTMERVYRWVAGVQMVAERPIFGFGPGNFYSHYTQYTVNSFKTYVSDNPEKSGIHSYYLMTAVEQGLVGLFIFLLLCFVVLLKGESIYHQSKDPTNKKQVLMVLLSLIIIYALLLINDMVETDKVGSFFFIFMAMLVNFDLKSQKSVTGSQ